jgi:hypothetical protein
MALQWKLDEEHSGWWTATVGDAVYWVGEADAEDFDVLFSPIGDFNSAEQLADNVVKRAAPRYQPLAQFAAAQRFPSGAIRESRRKLANCWLRFTAGSLNASTRRSERGEAAA